MRSCDFIKSVPIIAIITTIKDKAVFFIMNYVLKKAGNSPAFTEIDRYKVTKKRFNPQ